MTHYLALHETLEVHELLTIKNISLTKSTTMQGLAQDEELKNILAADVNTCRLSIQRLEDLITNRGDI